MTGTGGAIAPGTGGNGAGGTIVTGAGGARIDAGQAASGGSLGTGGGTGTGGTIAGSGGRIGTGGAIVTGAGGAGGAAVATFTEVATLLGMRCGGACHDGTNHVDLRNNTGLYARIVNAKPNASRTATQCRMSTLVVPSQPATSVLSEIVKGGVAACGNARMPESCPNQRACLTAAETARIDDWISAGALNN